MAFTFSNSNMEITLLLMATAMLREWLWSQLLNVDLNNVVFQQNVKLLTRPWNCCKTLFLAGHFQKWKRSRRDLAMSHLDFFYGAILSLKSTIINHEQFVTIRRTSMELYGGSCDSILASIRSHVY